MYEKINEPVHVLASFVGRKITPHAFTWGRKRYTVKRLNLVHTNRVGRELVFFFSVSDSSNTFVLSFSPSALAWKLEDLYTDGSN
ncbi:MAG: hypothetical protein WC497_03875 [Patescibacteria group bacterium]